MRNISSPMLASLTSNAIRPAFLVNLTFNSGPQYVWSGVGNLAYNGNTYLGVGSLGKLGIVAEGTDVHAAGTTVTLSGIDTTLLYECLTDISIGAPASIYFALLDPTGAILGTPYPLFVGTVDKPTVETGPDTISITLALENRMVDLQRATQRRYTAADQHVAYPDDIGFNWVEILNDTALRWGS